MKRFTATVMQHFKRVKVVHHLPGRLRLYIPLLEGLSPQWRRFQHDLIDIIKLHEGLIHIELSIISGRMLICYDPRRTSNTRILQWLGQVARTLYLGYVDAPFESRQHVVAFLKKMRPQLCHLLQRNNHVREVA